MGVSSASAPRRSALIAEETKELILEAAETEFAYCGFASARLEDIAERVGITRAAIIYHYGDKKTLYEAVLEAAFSSLTDSMRKELDSGSSHAERVERVVNTWIDVAGKRPTLARLYLREVADAREEFRPEVKHLFDPMFGLILEAVEEGQRAGAFRQFDPQHLISTLAGATTWFAINTPLLGSHTSLRPTSRQQDLSNDLTKVDTDIESNADDFAAYRKELMGVTRYLLGTSDTEKEG
ncbi:MAG: TetR/AcrR family transcriptional regulator [Deltaproteobacteria bacterium]|nr:TetR/AcrR family transcriptional regulator [Deltaproteobacteria bacterium]